MSGKERKTLGKQQIQQGIAVTYFPQQHSKHFS